MQSADRTDFDVAILGSGISGSSLAAILARHGLRVVILEAGEHPRFSIGESMILETSETLRAMAEFYDVPELRFYSSEAFLPEIGMSHGVKRHFSYLHHAEARVHDPRHCLQAVIPREPYGHELHLYRQDSDYQFATIAVQYGATLRQRTRVEKIEISENGVEIVTRAGAIIRVDYVVDAGRFGSVLAKQFSLRHQQLETHSRGLYTHMVGVPCFNDVGPSRRDYGIPFPLCQGTLHHVFEGGWLWLIPFDNHPRSTNPRCSVGLMLDPRIHPENPNRSPEEEFFAFVARFPSIAAQFRGARAVLPWSRSKRIQASSHETMVQHLDWDGIVLWEYLYFDSQVRHHHDIAVLPNGNVLLIAWELKTGAEAIAEGRDPATLFTGVLWPDHIVEVQPVGATGGNIVWELHAMRSPSPNRLTGIGSVPSNRRVAKSMKCGSETCVPPSPTNSVDAGPARYGLLDPDILGLPGMHAHAQL